MFNEQVVRNSGVRVFIPQKLKEWDRSDIGVI